MFKWEPHLDDLLSIEHNQAIANLQSNAFDYALPQEFVDEVRELTGLEAAGRMVWSYKTAKVFGEPYPIDHIGELVLKAYKHVKERQNAVRS